MSERSWERFELVNDFKDLESWPVGPILVNGRGKQTWRKTMKPTMKHILTFLLIGSLSLGAHAEDVYNFYFQKSPKKKAEVEPPQEENSEMVEEVVEVDHDVLLVPDNWQPAQKRYKKVYVKKTEKVYVSESNEVSTEVEEPKKKRKERGWSMKLGIGSVNVDQHYNTPYGWGNLQQKTYVVGSSYHMSRYFEVNAELHLPNGDAEEDTYSYGGNYNLDPQFTIGLGATPIHLNVFGGEFLAIGVDGGVTVGNRDSYSDSTSRIYLGPRVEMNFGEKFGLIYSYKNAINSDADFNMHSLALNYRF